MSYRGRSSQSCAAWFTCLLGLSLGTGCGDPNAVDNDFTTYTGNAVEAPDDADASAAGGQSGGETSGSSATVDAGATGTGGGTSTTGGTNTTGGTSTSGGASDAGVATGGSGSTGANVAGTLKFSVLTKATGGKYAPRNIGAIWVETASGTWVKTLAVWAATRERYLTRYVAASNRNRVDAVTSATQLLHTTHSVTWNATDVNRKVVADGDYRVVVEITDKDGTGDSTIIPFRKSAAPVKLSPPDQSHFVGMSLSYQ